MFEIAKVRKEYQAKGRVCINYTDRLTGKIKEQIKGENHVFTDTLFMNHGDTSWTKGNINISEAILEMTDSTDTIDTNFPYITGNCIGFGKPQFGSSGTTRGAYNAGVSYRAQSTCDDISWKFVYDFTPSQALGSIKTIGLTGQHFDMLTSRSPQNAHPSGFSRTGADVTGCLSTGAERITCLATGIVTVVSSITEQITTYDISAVVGTNASDYKVAGYNAVNGHCYIMVCSATSTRRFLYEFNNTAFETLLNTYVTSAFSFNYQEAAMFLELA